MAAVAKGTSILIVSLLVLSGFLTLASLLPFNVSANSTASIYVNGTRVFGPDGNNGNTVSTVNAPGSPNYQWNYSRSYFYDIRLTVSPGSGNLYVVSFTIVKPVPVGWTLDILDNTVGIGKAENSSIDGVTMGSKSSATDGFTGTVDYHANMTVVTPATGTPQAITFSLKVTTDDTASNDYDITTIDFVGNIGIPNMLPTITLSKPIGGQKYSNTVDCEWNATDMDDLPADLVISLQYKSFGTTIWTDFATSLHNTGTTDHGNYSWDCRGMDDGDYYIQATVKDLKNAVSKANITTPITIDNPDDPAIQIMNPSMGKSYEKSINVTWNATDADAGQTSTLLISIFFSNNSVSGIWYTLATDHANGGLYIWDISELPNGNDYKIKAVATDTTALAGQSITPAFVINNMFPPVVSLSYPAAGVTATGTKSVYWSAESNRDLSTSLKMNITYSLDNGSTWTNIANGEINDGEYSWNTMTCPNSDNCILNVSAKDSRQQIGYAISGKFKVFNNHGPVISFVHPTEGATLEGKTAIIQWLAMDQETPAGNLSITLEYKAANPTWAVIEGCFDIANTGEHIWNTTELADGAYRLRLGVKDADGASVQAVSGNFTIFNPDPPEVILLSPKDGSTLKGQVEITWNATDDDAGETENLKMELFYSPTGIRAGGSWVVIAVDLNNTGSYVWNTTAILRSDVYLRVVAKDGTFEAFAQSGRMTVNNTHNHSPVVTVVKPDVDGMGIKGTYAIEWTATDEDGDALLISIEYSKDKASWTGIGSAKDLANSGSFLWDTKTVADGGYFVKITAYDGKIMSAATSKKIDINNTVTPVTHGDDTNSTDDQSPQMWTTVFIIIFIVILVMIAALILIVILAKRRKKAADAESARTEQQPALEPEIVTQTPSENKTVSRAWGDASPSLVDQSGAGLGMAGLSEAGPSMAVPGEADPGMVGPGEEDPSMMGPSEDNPYEAQTPGERILGSNVTGYLPPSNADDTADTQQPPQ